LPKKSALTDYSYRTSHENQRAFLAALNTAMIDGGLATSPEAIFDLDFHAVMHWGHDPVLEKHYVPTRSQRAHSVLTFFAQDTGTHNLVYANADISKSTQAREAITFCDHWKAVSGADPHMLIMDQRVTTQPVLGELDARGVKFLTLRMRSPTLVKQINALTSKDFKTITSFVLAAVSAAARRCGELGPVELGASAGVGGAATISLELARMMSSARGYHQYLRLPPGGRLWLPVRPASTMSASI
jgi:hypothetical protein